MPAPPDNASCARPSSGLACSSESCEIAPPDFHVADPLQPAGEGALRLRIGRVTRQDAGDFQSFLVFL
jgi:hypothetical protein